MARKLRVEYPGAIQHVLNRGNYRYDVFADDSTKRSFEICLFEACERSNWILHAFIVMRNHYHLALETPDANLITGMQWLQSTFASRFNRFRCENGHLFQGRYKAILTEEGKTLGEVCDYIHLNPVKAGIVPANRLPTYRFSSYWYLHQPEMRPKFLRPQTGLECACGVGDSPRGWAQYAKLLELESESMLATAGWKKRERALCRGWAIGGDEFKARLVKEYSLAGELRSSDEVGVREVRLIQWDTILQKGLHALGRSNEDALVQPKSAPWKLALAAWMKTRTQVSNHWLTAKLNLGVPTAVSHNLTGYRRSLQSTDPSWKRLTTVYLA
jgi:REP element-mobilizing transposase RayT